MSFCLWLTGLPGSGKSTISAELEELLQESGMGAAVLSLDRIRKVVTPSPQYTTEEREIVYRSLAVMAQLLVKEGHKNVIIDATGNRRAFRDLARELIPDFAEIYVKCPLETCESRETSRQNQLVQKDLYKRASEGKLNGKMPGVSAPYEAPLHPEVVVESDNLSPAESAQKIMAYVRSRWLSQGKDVPKK